MSGFEGGPSESQSYCEHQAALEATLFGPRGTLDEVVFELQAGELRVRTPDPD